MEEPRICCRSCGAPLNDFDPRQETVTCPYCHSVNQVADLLQDSDAVRIEKIRARTKAHMEAMREKEKTRRAYKMANARQTHFTPFSDLIWSLLPYGLGFLAFGCLLLALPLFVEEKAYMACALLVVLAILMGTAACLGPGIRTRKAANILTILSLVLVVPCIAVLLYSIDPARDPIVLTDLYLCQQLPAPADPHGEIRDNDSDTLELKLYGYTMTDFLQYRKTCEEAGYTVEPQEDQWTYEAHEPGGHKIRLSFLDSLQILEVRLTAPLELGSDFWPEGYLGTLIPKPRSNRGLVNYEADNYFSVCIGDITPEAYLKYTEDLEKMGFEPSYSSSVYKFYGTDSRAFRVEVEYEGMNIIRLYLRIPPDYQK